VYVVYTCIQEAIIDYPSYTKETHKSTFRGCCPLPCHIGKTVFGEKKNACLFLHILFLQKVQQFKKTVNSIQEKNIISTWPEVSKT